MKKKVIINRLLITLLCVVMVFISLIGANNVSVLAKERITYDESNALDDLTGATIGGKVFNTADFPFNANGQAQVIYFSEFCYSYDKTKLDDYALYVYVYNPQGLVFDDNVKNNTIAFACGENTEYKIYGLKFLNYSTQQGYEGRFYKFKVNLSDTQKSYVLSNVKSDERIYKISEVELAVKGNVENYTVLSTYKYKGYSLGYGSDVMTTSSLACTVDGFDKYVTLEVDSTYYRPEGLNGNKDFQDSLHSVYFSLSNKVSKEYGEITGATATFYDALLKPALATTYKEGYNALYKYLGVDIGEGNNNLEYSFIANSSTDLDFPVEDFTSTFLFDYGYNIQSINHLDASNIITALNILFYVNAEDFSYEACAEVVSAEEVEKKILELTKYYGDKDVMGRYSSKLFEYVAEEPTLLNIDKQSVNGETLSLVKQVITQNWWQRLWGNSSSSITRYDNIPPLEAVNYSDLSLSDKALSDKYYVAMPDIEDFRERCKSAKANDETVYLLRYRISDYKAWNSCFVYEAGSIIGYPNAVEGSRGILFQMHSDLGFQIIDLRFTKDNVTTILPVLSKPQDIFHGATTPVGIEKSGCTGDIFSLVVTLLVVGVILFFVIKYLVEIWKSTMNRFMQILLTILVILAGALVAYGIYYLLSFLSSCVSC